MISVMVSRFYLGCAGTLFVLWAALSLGSGQDIHRRALTAPLFVRPSWLPARWLARLHRCPPLYLMLCHLAPVAFLSASVFPDYRLARLLAALSFSAYHLSESSITHSHRDYPTLYICWALVVLPSDNLIAGFSLGVCVHFIASSGFAKLLIGGTSGWASPGTMRAILRTYLPHSLASSGPASPALAAWASGQDVVMVLISIGTLIFECILVPCSLFMPKELRWMMVLASVGLHIGIAILQSAVIGLAFLGNVPGYILGFASDTVTVGSVGWWCAIMICTLSAGSVILRRRVLPEDWPCSPIALFAWNHSQWALLFKRFVTGDTRLVLCSEPEQCVAGTPVVNKWGARWGSGESSGGAKVHLRNNRCCVFDGWEQVIGETLVFSAVLDALQDDFFDEVTDRRWDATNFVRRIQEWLLTEQRLVEIYTGRPLVCAYFVRVEPDKEGGCVIKEVLT